MGKNRKDNEDVPIEVVREIKISTDKILDENATVKSRMTNWYYIKKLIKTYIKKNDIE